jgi:hypothetical protein
MEYKVIPFVASIDRTRNAQKQVSDQLEEIIQNQATLGWNYVRLESVTSFVKPDTGCFGFGGSPGFTTHRQMIVFNKN